MGNGCCALDKDTLSKKTREIKVTKQSNSETSQSNIKPPLIPKNKMDSKNLVSNDVVFPLISPNMDSPNRIPVKKISIHKVPKLRTSDNSELENFQVKRLSGFAITEGSDYKRKSKFCNEGNFEFKLLEEKRYSNKNEVSSKSSLESVESNINQLSIDPRKFDSTTEFGIKENQVPLKIEMKKLFEKIEKI